MASRPDRLGGKSDYLTVFSYFSSFGNIPDGKLVSQWDFCGRFYVPIHRRDFFAGANVPAGNGDIVFGPKNDSGWRR